MNNSNNLKLLFVINPVSGSTNNSWEDMIRQYFTGKTFTIEYLVLDKIPDTQQIKIKIKEFSPDRVIAVGGDGTVTMVAKIVADSHATLGIIPAGSANGMAKELNIPENINAALDTVIHGATRCCDAILINEAEVCLHLSDIGLNAQLVKYFDEGKVRGKLGYGKVILKTLWRKQKMQVIITTHKEEIRRNAFMVVLANASKYGTGAVINPLGQLDDGAFEVVVVRRLALSELLKMLFRPQPFNPQKIEIFTATNVDMETMKSVHFQVDGEYKGKINRLKAVILPKYINIILPRS